MLNKKREARVTAHGNLLVESLYSSNLKSSRNLIDKKIQNLVKFGIIISEKHINVAIEYFSNIYASIMSKNEPVSILRIFKQLQNSFTSFLNITLDGDENYNFNDFYNSLELINDMLVIELKSF